VVGNIHVAAGPKGISILATKSQEVFIVVRHVPLYDEQRYMNCLWNAFSFQRTASYLINV
jgi:hypothetical protein